MKYFSTTTVLLGVSGFLFGGAQPASCQQELFTLTASDGAWGDEFGASVAIAGTRGIVGAIANKDFGHYTGSAYVYDVTTGQQLFKLLASNASSIDFFGYSVAMSSEYAAVGATRGTGIASDTGAVYVFDVATGQELIKLSASDGEPTDFLGYGVAISGDRVVAGCAYDDDGAVLEKGSAYVFDLTTGQQLFKLVASDGAHGDHFGFSVAASGDLAIVGERANSNPGGVYVFDLTTGQELRKLTPSGGGGGFGRSVSISGNLAVVGSGGAPVYVFDVTTGQELYQLFPAQYSAGFGSSVAISGDRVVIGAYRDDDNGTDSGSVYVFDVTTGSELFKLTASDGVANDEFGYSVAISGHRTLVGAPFDEVLGTDPGAVYTYAIPQDQGSRFCFGDGSGAACPCANGGSAGAGCANSSGGGARVLAAGSTSASADELVLTATNLLTSQPAVLFAGSNAIDGGNGAPFGDGLRCAGGSVARLGVELPVARQAIWGPGLAARAGWQGGDTRRLQVWYRDPGGPCGAGFNLTNGVELTFSP